MGVERYNMEQMEKARQLETLLENYNDGRKKTFSARRSICCLCRI